MDTLTSIGMGRDSMPPLVDGEVRPLPGALLIPLARLERDPGQPRRDWRHQDTQERLEELVESGRTDGILQPLVVREHPDKPGYYIVVAGGMRLYAARQVGLSAVPACVRSTDGARMRA